MYMYLDHFGLSEPPFRITPDTVFFFQGANRGATLEALAYAITHDEGIVKVSGEVGSGKTMLCRVLMERLPKNVETIYLANPSLSREEILYAIADELKLGLNASRTTRLMRALLAHLIQLFSEGRRVVVLIDEAHAMPKESLEEIRLLSNLESNRHKLLQMVLFGQPELDQHLNTADMRQLKERITHSFRLEPLVRSDIESYIDFRMRAAGYRGPNVFSPAAIRLITDASEGLTRRVNILADKSLLAAFADGSHAVTDKEVKRAIADSEFYRPPRSLQKIWAGAGALAAGLALGWGVSVWFSASPDAKPVAQAPVPLAPAQSVFGSVRDAPAVPIAKPAGEQAAPAAPAVSTAKPAMEKPAPVAPAAPTAKPAVGPAAPVSPAGSPGAIQSALAPAALPSTKTPAPPVAAPSRQSPTSSTTALAPPAPSSPPALARTKMAPAEASTPAVQPEPLSPAEAAPGPPARGKLARERFAATQEWLNSAPGDRYSIQLITVKATEAARLEDFLLKASKSVNPDELFVYSVKIDGQQYYRAAYGSFQGARATVAAMQALPPLLKAQSSYYRSVERMRSQNRQ